MEFGDSLEPGKNISLCVLEKKLVIPKVIPHIKLIASPAKIIQIIAYSVWDKCIVHENLFTLVSF